MTQFNDIKIGDIIGKESFPYEMAEVIGIEGDILVTKLTTRQADNGQDIIRPITKRQIEKGVFVKLDIIDGEIEENLENLPL